MLGEVDVKRAARGQRKRSELETRVKMRMGARSHWFVVDVDLLIWETLS